MTNIHGIQWIVRDHISFPTYNTLHRRRSGDVRPADDFYPVIEPLNLSPRLAEFALAIDRCTTKVMVITDTMPGRRNDGHLPGANSIDTICHPEANIMLLDASRASETVIAHELGHVWVQYVDECEDVRAMKESSDPSRMRLVGLIQSFVLDFKVNEVIHQKGFNMAPIEEDQLFAVSQLEQAITGGYRPEFPGEEVFMALLAAGAIVCRKGAGDSELANVEDAIHSLSRSYPPLIHLANQLAGFVGTIGYSDQRAVMLCIDNCLRACFEHMRDKFDPELELIALDPQEPQFNKHPEWLSPLRPRSKCVVGQFMAKNNIASDWGVDLVATELGQAQLTFYPPDDGLPLRIALPDRIVQRNLSPLSIFTVEEIANRTRNFCGDPSSGLDNSFNAVAPGFNSWGASFGPELPQIPTAPSAVSPKAPSPAHWPVPPGRQYVVGIGRFLTAVRLEERLRGEHPYSYALNNPTTYTDPSGLKTCEQIRDECIDEATKHQGICQRHADEVFTVERAVCNALSGGAKLACLIAAQVRFTDALLACRIDHTWRFDFCRLEYAACKEGRDAAHQVVCFTAAGIVTYCIYQAGKDVIGACTGNPEVWAVP